MMSIKRFLFPLAAALLLACGFAFTAQADDYEGFSPAKFFVDVGQLALPAAERAERATSEPAVSMWRSPALRSDMRVSSAGMVFKSTVDAIQRESTSPP